MGLSRLVQVVLQNLVRALVAFSLQNFALVMNVTLNL